MTSQLHVAAPVEDQNVPDRPSEVPERGKRPPLPRWMYRPSPIMALAFLAYALGLFIVPSAVARIIYEYFGVGVLQIALMVPLVILSGFGLNLMGFAGHEGMHLSLFRNKHISATVGIFFASAVTTYYELGFAMQHWNHHRYTNQASDHDITMVQHLKTWWQRLLFARATYNLAYLQATFRTALGRPNPFRYKMPFRTEQLKVLARLNLLFSAFWLALYVTITVVDPMTGLICILLPMACILFISSCQTYIDHAGTSDEMFHNAWSRTSPIMTALYFGANYHLEHHLYPGVPCYRLGRVHRILKENGTYDRENPPIENGFLASYRRLGAPYQPGVDRDFDPLAPAVS